MFWFTDSFDDCMLLVVKVRVKDVLTEFYAILIDLFDSYAFMGPLLVMRTSRVP